MGKCWPMRNLQQRWMPEGTQSVISIAIMGEGAMRPRARVCTHNCNALCWCESSATNGTSTVTVRGK